jgi:pseudaminic acid synthase
VAINSVISAKNAGADAIKLQTYTADTITIDCDDPLFRLPENTLWAGKTLYQLYQEACTPYEWHEELKYLANSLGMELFSSPFDPTAADFLRSLDMPAYKIASFEIFDIPLIKHVASFGKPIIISTGMADISAIDEAVQACKSAGNEDIILLKCTSAYPAPLDKANLATIPHLRDTFGVLSGLSDHTEGHVAAAAATALGACVIEKHFILDKGMESHDKAFSLDPVEFRQMVDIVRDVERTVGVVSYAISREVEAMRKVAR